VKSALLLVVGGLGLVSSARLHGRWPAWLGSLGQRVAARRPSRHLVLIEAGAGAVLLLAVGVLVESVPARGPAGASALAPPPASAQTSSGSVADLVVTVSATPNRPGVNGFTVMAASSRRPPPAPLQDVALSLGGGAGAVTLRQVGPGRWFGTGRLERAGNLRLQAVIRRSGKRLAVPFSWWVGPPVEPPSAARPTSPDRGRRLAPYVDGIAVSLLVGALGVGAGWLVLARRRRRRPPPVIPAAVPAQKPPERVLKGVR
jgi:copper transport protein